MELPEQNELEKFIHAQLQKLPEREAPENLVSNVMAAIAMRKNQPWWKQPFTCWPRNCQNVFLFTLASLFVSVAYVGMQAFDLIAFPNWNAQLSSVSWIGQLFQSLYESLFLVLRALPLEAYVVIGCLLAAMYALCIAAGVALYKVTSGTSTQAA